jgi:hypothetical protein
MKYAFISQIDRVRDWLKPCRRGRSSTASHVVLLNLIGSVVLYHYLLFTKERPEILNFTVGLWKHMLKDPAWWLMSLNFLDWRLHFELVACGFFLVPAWIQTRIPIQSTWERNDRVKGSSLSTTRNWGWHNPFGDITSERMAENGPRLSTCDDPFSEKNESFWSSKKNIVHAIFKQMREGCVK